MLDFMGHLHPIIVHLPIGILLFGVCMMLIQHYKNIDLNQVISLAFLFGSICAAFACLTGWLLSKSDEYDVLLVQKHQWSGIVTTVFGLLSYVLKQYRKLFAIALTLLILITGHYGGTLTHGDNYLFNVSEGSNTIAHDTLNTTSKRNTQEISNGSDTLKLVRSNLYKDEVAPLLKMRCYNCHSAIKQKNGLRLDGEMFIKRGGKNGTVVVAGNIFKSPLYTSLNLPIEDEKHMPPKGKQQLNEVEILIIEHWIKSGASFEDKIDTITNKELSSNTATRKISVDTIISSYKNINTSAAIITRNIQKKNKNRNANVDLIKISNTANPLPISPDIIETVKQENIILTPLSEGSNFVMANFVNVVPFNKNSLQVLKKIHQQLVSLKLSNLPINDDDIKIVADLKNIKKLNLENTFITDYGITYLKQLSELEQLNLYGTNITDDGLNQLASLKKLSALYLWKTKVTMDGIEKFKKTHPNLSIELGSFKFQKK